VHLRDVRVNVVEKAIWCELVSGGKCVAIILTGRTQAVEEAETRFRTGDEIWEPLEELVEF